MSEQNDHEFSEDERAFALHQALHTNQSHNNEHPTYQQAPAFYSPNGSINPFNPISSSYGHFDNVGTLVNYQRAFQPLDLDPQNHMHTYSGAYPSSMHAPIGFYNPPILEQPWVDEIHPSYTLVGGENFEWAPVDTQSYGGLVGTSFTNSAEQVVYDQCSPLEAVESEAFISQRFVLETVPRVPLQQPLSTRPASVALKVRNEKLRKDVTTALYNRADHNSHRSTRISKTKKVDKVDNGVKQEACWRCKRYRKACIGQDVCKECSTADFRVWPSAIGCRRGAMEGFVEKIMPVHSVDILRDLCMGVSRTSNWRKALYQPHEVPISSNNTNPADRWDLLKRKVQSTMVFGPEFSALVNILATYEHSRKTEIPMWTQSIILLSSTCDFYHFFVASSSTEVQLPLLINATIKFRKSLARSWDIFLKSCLSGRRESWFPAFLAVVLGICSMVILLDAIPSMPGPTRKAIWADVEAIVRDLRVRQYMMSLDLLRIGAKGINPLKLDCWVVEEETDSEGRKAQKRDPKGMALLGHDSAAFDGFIMLRQWHSKYKAAMLQGNDMWDSVPYTKSHIQAIAALSKVFEF